MLLGTCDRPSSKRPVRKSRQIVVDFTDERASFGEANEPFRMAFINARSSITAGSTVLRPFCPAFGLAGGPAVFVIGALRRALRRSQVSFSSRIRRRLRPLRLRMNF